MPGKSVRANKRGMVTEISHVVLCSYVDLEYPIKLLAGER